MIEEIAVVQLVDDRMISVKTTKQSGCQACEQSNSCSTSLFSKYLGNKEMELMLETDLLLNPGDKVIVGLDEHVFFKLTFLVYLLPIGVFFLFAIIGQYLTEQFQVGNEIFIFLFALFGLISSFYGVSRFKNQWVSLDKLSPVVLKKY